MNRSVRFKFLDKLKFFFALIISISIKQNPSLVMTKKVVLMGLFQKYKLSFFAKFLQRSIYKKNNCEISRKANISDTVGFPHAIGIVIGSEVNIAHDVTILQNVTIGGRSIKTIGMPKINSGSTIYSGAVIAGPIVVGKNVTIGANAVVTKDIPCNSIVVGYNKILVND